MRNGDVKAYAVTSSTRLAAAPDIPTVDEAGAPGVYISTWYGMWVPKGTPPEAIRQADGRRHGCARRSGRARSGSLASGRRFPPREQQTAEALAAHHKAEIEKWWPHDQGRQHQGRVTAGQCAISRDALNSQAD